MNRFTSAAVAFFRRRVGADFRGETAETLRRELQDIIAPVLDTLPIPAGELLYEGFNAIDFNAVAKHLKKGASRHA
jgi:hypothetical protein